MSRESRPPCGSLYLVATPIGNLADFTYRAVEVLRSVDLIACEDTRRSRALLDHYGIDRPLLALHEHNEDAVSGRLIERLQGGEAVALISDAGTPLINDPGFPLVRLARAAGIRVSPIPGPCALIAALSASGLPSHRFCFEGFPPRKQQARRSWFESLRPETRTLIFYESSHRVEETLRDAASIFPPERRVVIARELTKRFETLIMTTLAEVDALFTDHAEMRLGEFVLLIEGETLTPDKRDITAEQRQLLSRLMRELSLKSAVSLTCEISGARREVIYREALRLAAVDPETGEG